MTPVQQVPLNPPTPEKPPATYGLKGEATYGGHK